MLKFPKYQLKSYTVNAVAESGGLATFRLHNAFVFLGVFYHDGVNDLVQMDYAVTYDFANNPVRDKSEVFRRCGIASSTLGLSSILPNVDLSDIDFPEGVYYFTQAEAQTMVLYTLEKIECQ